MRLKGRRSIRCFKKQAVEGTVLHSIIKAGTWAPSGLNHLPGTMEFMALIALGYPAEENAVSERKKMKR